jgi:DNA excision repair protein ERCC-3
MQEYQPLNPLFVQGDLELLLEVANPLYIQARDAIAPFTELVKSPEHLHTYRISPLSLWNAAASGHKSDEVLQRLRDFSKFPIPPNVIQEIRSTMERYGKIRLVRYEDGLALESDDDRLIFEISKAKGVENLLGEEIDLHRFRVLPEARGLIKSTLAKLRFPVEDIAGYTEGNPLDISLRQECLSGKPFVLRDYQKEASEIFYAAGGPRGGSGVVVLPCGAGKTVVALSAMSLVKGHTLILSPNIIAARQWIREILDKTTLTEDQVKEYSGERKEIGPVTVATYQILTIKGGSGTPTHFGIFDQHKWGLIVFDEVHLLPAPIFRMCADVQATRRLGLTATLIREDGKETEVFSLIGPKKFDLPWKRLEAEGWIATAHCTEIRIPLDDSVRMGYAVSPDRDKIRLASTNPHKRWVVKELIEKHCQPEDRVLLIGQYIDQLEELSKDFKIPLITGKTPNKEREKLYGAFRCGELKQLMVSKVGNFAVDLPDANVLIQVSGTFGSRQEEAQRLGRVLRPKADGGQAWFYSVITQDTKEQDFAMNRQLFLAEQGYEYDIQHWN